MIRPLHEDHELVLTAIRSLEVPASDRQRRTGWTMDTIRANTARIAGRNNPLPTSRTRRALADLAQRFSHADGPPVGASSPNIEPALYRSRAWGKPWRYRLSERGRELADELLVRELQRQGTGGDRVEVVSAHRITITDDGTDEAHWHDADHLRRATERLRNVEGGS